MSDFLFGVYYVVGLVLTHRMMGATLNQIWGERRGQRPLEGADIGLCCCWALFWPAIVPYGYYLIDRDKP